MDDERLDRLLEELKHDDSIPDPPANLESRVLREIRLENPEEDDEPNWISVIFGRGLAFASAVGVFALGLGLIVGSVAPNAAEASQAVAARSALSLDVFHPRSDHSPHSLLFHREH